MKKITHKHHPRWQALGVQGGVVAGLVWLVYTVINNLSDVSGTNYRLMTNVSLYLLLAIPFVVAFLSARESRKTGEGVKGGMTALGIGMGIGALALLFVTFLFMDVIRSNSGMIGDFKRSGMADIRLFILEDAFGSILFGGTIMGLLGLVTSVGGAWMGALAGGKKKG